MTLAKEQLKAAGVELSYLDLCNLLFTGLQEDTVMPCGVRDSALEILMELEGKIGSYSY